MNRSHLNQPIGVLGLVVDAAEQALIPLPEPPPAEPHRRKVGRVEAAADHSAAEALLAEAVG